jgi:large subunit ribosomal protein L3
MTRLFTEDGRSVPVTVLEVGPCVVTQVRTPEVDGYSGVQIAYEDLKPRNSTIPLIAHDHKAGTTPKRFHREFRVAEAGGYELGQTLDASSFGSVLFVDVAGTSKGKGFAGGMKRHGFKGKEASHGVERKHRGPGSIGGHASNRGTSGGIKKGKKMAGQLGNERVTVRSLEVVRVDTDRNLVLVKGPVPGANGGLVEVRPAVRLYKSKAAKAAAKG